VPLISQMGSGSAQQNVMCDNLHLVHKGYMKPRRVRRTYSVTRHLNILDGRPGFCLQSQWGHVSVLQGGGHICELVSHKHDGVNPLWKPTWKTIDPVLYYEKKHPRVYGPPPEGKLLAGIAGHSISFDFFGPPSKEEIAAGHNTHGEAPVVNWRKRPRANTTQPTLAYEATLPRAQMHLHRIITLDRTAPVVYCEETASNLSTFDQPISWNHHVTFGPPFLEPDVTLFDMPATRSKVCPASFSTQMLIQPDAEFQWPNAPMKEGGVLNLRTSQDAKYGHYTAHLLESKLENAFIAVCNPRLRLLVLYLFKRNDYPWVGNWEESYSRTHRPWNGREFCRGFEFSTTPFPIPRREMVTNGKLFGESTYVWLPAKGRSTTRYMIAMLEVPDNFNGVETVELKSDSLLITERSRHAILQTPVKHFL
jgi:hypothetical protein